MIPSRSVSIKIFTLHQPIHLPCINQQSPNSHLQIDNPSLFTEWETGKRIHMGYPLSSLPFDERAWISDLQARRTWKEAAVLYLSCILRFLTFRRKRERGLVHVKHRVQNGTHRLGCLCHIVFVPTVQFKTKADQADENRLLGFRQQRPNLF